MTAMGQAKKSSELLKKGVFPRGSDVHPDGQNCSNQRM
jgi:hypothetical protein